MESIKKNNGFTLVELVVAVVVLGIIVAIVLPTVNSIKDKNELKKYTSYEELILSSVKLYVDAYEADEFNKDSLSAQCKAVTYDDLKNHNLLKEYNVGGVKCGGKTLGAESNIAAYVYRNIDGKYKYYPMISCMSEDSVVYNSSIVTVPDICVKSLQKVSIASANTCFNDGNTEIKLDLSNIEANDKIIAIDYTIIPVIDKDSTETIKEADYNSLYDNTNPQFTKTITIDDSLLEKNKDVSIDYNLVLRYTYVEEDVKYEVYDKKITVDYTKPEITLNAVKYDNGVKYVPGEWTNKDVYIEATIKKGCNKKETDFKVITQEGINNVEFTETYGEESIITKKMVVKIDKTAPTVPTVTLKKWSDNLTRPKVGNYKALADYNAGDWSSEKIYTIASGSTDTCFDGIACSDGIKYYYTTTGKTTNSTDKNRTYRNIEAEGISYIQYKACDAVGNCSSYTNPFIIKIDYTAPTPYTLNIIGSNNKSYFSEGCCKGADAEGNVTCCGIKTGNGPLEYFKPEDSMSGIDSTSEQVQWYVDFGSPDIIQESAIATDWKNRAEYMNESGALTFKRTKKTDVIVYKRKVKDKAGNKSPIFTLYIYAKGSGYSNSSGNRKQCN